VDNCLKRNEMRNLASLVGFEGNDTEWDAEYQKLCSEHNLSPDNGVPHVIVMQLLDDDSDNGCYCTDTELCELVGNAPAPHASALEAANHGSRTDEAGKVFFAGANFDTEEAVLKDVFAEVGTVLEFSLFRMPDNRSRGMGVVLYSSGDEAERAISDLHQREVDGRMILVQEDAKKSGIEANGRRQDARRGKGEREIWSEGYDAQWAEAEWSEPSGNGKGGAKGTRKERKQNKDAGLEAWYPDDGWGKAGGKKGDGWGKGGGKKGHAFDDGWGKGGYGAYTEDMEWHRAQRVMDYYGYETDGYTVFFAGASFDTTSGHLRKLFQEAGRITQFWLFQLPDGRSRGMGVVQYATFDEAQYSIELMHTRMVDGRSIMVKIDDVGALASEGQGFYAGGGGKGWAGGKGGHLEPMWTNRVFFAGAPFHCNEGTLRSYFAAFGTIRSFTVFWLNDGRHRGMGVCTYSSNEEAGYALNEGIEVEGRPLFLQEDASQYGAEGGPVKGKGKQASLHEASASSSYGTGKDKKAGARSNPADQNYDSYSAGLYGVDVDPKKAVFFANAAFETTETHLKSKFEIVGKVKHLILFMTPDGKSRGKGIRGIYQAGSCGQRHR